MNDLFFAAIHHIFAATVLVCAVSSLVLLRRGFDLQLAGQLQRIDMLNAVAATIVLLAGLARVFYYGKGADYYFHSLPFITKLALYGVASVLSLVPTIEMKRWRTALKLGQVPVVTEKKLAGLRGIAAWQLVCVLGMAVCASLAARGFGSLG